MRKQKHPRLPSGFGTIRYLGKNRSRPYQVRAAAHMDGDEIVAGEILAYTDDWYKAFALLTAYNAHTWHPGDDVEDLFIDASEGLEGVVKRLLDDYRHISGKTLKIINGNTFNSIAWEWYRDKYENESKRKYSEAIKTNMRRGIELLSPIAERSFASLRLVDLQSAIDSIDKPTMQVLAKTVIKGSYQYALARDIVQKDYSIGIRLDAHTHKSGTPFSVKEIQKIWKLRDDPEAEMLIIMIYSGFRISAYKDLEINLKDRYFRGGVKTAAGKERIVPIHHMIFPLVEKRLKRDGFLMQRDHHHYGNKLTSWCSAHGMKHSPHHTRHTFSMLCERSGVRENDRKRLLGHHFDDVTNEVYGHRSLEDLRAEIEKIPICDNL